MASVAPASSPSASAPPAPFGRKLRVGVVADSPLQPRWLVESLARVAAGGFAELYENGVRDSFSREKPSLTPFSVYRALDRRLFGAADWSRPVELATLPMTRGGEDVDLIVALGDVADDAIAMQPTYGVWRYCFGDENDTRVANAGIREVLSETQVTRSGLLVRMPGGEERVACQSWARTLPYSVARSRDNLFAKTLEFLPRVLRELHRTGRIEGETVSGTISPEIVPDTVSMLGRVARRAIEKATTVEQWGLAFRFVDIEPWTGSLERFHRLTPPGDGFWADPFPLQRNGKSYIFFEELPRADGRAHISVIEVDRSGRASAPVRVLERDYHLSYPFLVEEGGELYMVPESAENRTVEIYRCVDFPRKWQLERVLLDDVFAADATLHRADGRWWMFAVVGANGAEIHDELHVFTSETLLGDWRPLARNPVKSDVRSARPAGRLFTRGGALYRPAQVCAPLYGAGIALQRVTRLDEDHYEERQERTILPWPGEKVLGLHTMNRAGDLSVTDAFVRRSRFRTA